MARQPYIQVYLFFIEPILIQNTAYHGSQEVLGTITGGHYFHTAGVGSSIKHGLLYNKSRGGLSFHFSVRHVRTTCKYSTPGATLKHQDKASLDVLRDKKIVPDSDPPSIKDVNLLYQFIDESRKLMVLTGAGISTESGIPDYRSPNGAYSSGFKPITHQIQNRL
ncbi:NAD-dependent protein deacylase SRT2-like isoform X1 [Tasmannia lanceolata]|uniref:NAD-dependent protein deacylase SRT2-like isoform X1 n=1 Tax=Tasmannia lanceolata TaxID=3420 RepID=UPI004064785A